MTKIIFKLFLSLLAVLSLCLIFQQKKLMALTLTRINPIPEVQKMIAAQHYAEAANYLDFFMQFHYVNSNPKAVALHNEIKEMRESWRYRASKIGEGLWSGNSDENIGRITGIATDFFVIGDIRDLAIEGVHLAKGEEVDEVLVALSSLGIVASGAQIVSGVGTATTAGAAAPALAGSSIAKSGLITLKVARKIGKLPSWLNKTIINTAKTAKKTKSLGALGDMLGDLSSLAKTKGGFELLSQTTDTASLSRIAKFSRQFGAQSIVIYRIGGEHAVKLAKKLGEAGETLFKQSVTYGKKGIALLAKIDKKAFIEVLRVTDSNPPATGTTGKRNTTHIAAEYLLRLPKWLLICLTLSGILIWIPFPKIIKKCAKSIQSTVGKKIAGTQKS